MAEPYIQRIPETPDLPHPLGRHVHHDPRSRTFPFRPPVTVELRSVLWDRRVPIFDQGTLGSCTGNAAAGWIATADALHPGLAAVAGHGPVDEQLAVWLYEQATRIDPFDGTYEPDDTGSDGLSVTKVLVQLGVVDRYEHAFSADAALAALMLGPVLVGTNWYQGMFDPDARGVVTPSGSVAGGHEYLLVGYDADAELVTFANSWGAGWGAGGYGRMTVPTLRRLLAEDGDATIPHAPVAAPVPPEPPPLLVALDPAVAARVVRAAARRHLDPAAWVNSHLRRYFDEV